MRFLFPYVLVLTRPPLGERRVFLSCVDSLGADMPARPIVRTLNCRRRRASSGVPAAKGNSQQAPAYLIACGLIGEPVPPVMISGGPQKKNS